MVVCHSVTRAIAVPSLDVSQNMSEFEVKRSQKSAESLNIPSATKCWQLLLKGYSEIQSTGYRTLDEGATVEFEITQGRKGLQASAVTIVSN